MCVHECVCAHVNVVGGMCKFVSVRGCMRVCVGGYLSVLTWGWGVREQGQQVRVRRWSQVEPGLACGWELQVITPRGTYQASCPHPSLSAIQGKHRQKSPGFWNYLNPIPGPTLPLWVV